MVTMQSSIAAAALKYAELGLSVVPIHSATAGRCSCSNGRCESPGKHPRLRWRGQSQAALTADELVQLWQKYPDSNVGIVTGKISRLVVIDIDGEEGIQALLGIGLDVDKLEAPAVQSGGGGLHIYCRYPIDANYDLTTRAGVLPSVDIRADGGLIIAPPSIHSSGEPYQWVEGMSLWDMPPVKLDLAWTAESHYSSRSNGKTYVAGEDAWYEDLLLSGTVEGSRNDSATRLAGRWLGLGLSEIETLFALQAWNQTNDPPMSRRELEIVVDSILRREIGQQLDRVGALVRINQTLKVLNLLDVLRITGDEPQLILKFQEGDMQITTEALMSPHLFMIAVAKATKIVIKAFGTKRYPTQADLGKWIMDISRDEDAGREATTLGDMEAIVLDYLDSQRVTTLDENAEVPRHGCFRLKADGVIWIGLGEFVDWVNGKAGTKMSRPQTAQRLKALGWRKHEFPTDEHGKRPAWAKA